MTIFDSLVLSCDTNTVHLISPVIQLLCHVMQACPTSSVFTNCQTLDSHAIKRWALDGISFSLNTDDPGVIGNDLITEYNVASQQLGLDRTQIVQSVSRVVQSKIG